MVFDMHGDLFTHFLRQGKKGETEIFKKYHLDNFKKGNCTFSVFNFWIDSHDCTDINLFLENLEYGAIECMKNKDVLNKLDTFKDFDKNKVNYIIGLEGVDYLTNANQLYMLYEYGVRLIGLTWNANNVFAHAQAKDPMKGLTEEGFKAIEIMNELGMIIDVSHLSDQSFEDILNHSTKPVIASHSNSRTLCNSGRNLTDEQMKKIAKKNGIIGMNGYRWFISKEESGQNISGFVDHIDYVKNLVGIEYIGFGFDFMDYLDDKSQTTTISDYTCTTGLRNHSDIKDIIIELEKRGYTSDEIDAISYKNVLRVFNSILK